MRLKVISICLFLLFCLVIAFPGYSKPRVIGNKSSISFLTSTTTSSIGIILLKCLSSGINMVEEERTNEHQDDDTTPDEVYIPSYMSPAIIASYSLFPFAGNAVFIEQLAHTDIFSPPDLLA